MSKEWKDIPGYEGIYRASINGRIESIKRKSCNGRILKPVKLKCGYCQVVLCKENNAIQHRYHRLIALTFLDNPQNKPEVNHKDGNKYNNKVSNLEWTTVSENRQHAYDTNLRQGALLDVKGEANKLSIPINQLSLDGGFIKRFCSAAEAERQTGFNHSMIASVCRGKRKRIYGYKWEYANKLLKLN